MAGVMRFVIVREKDVDEQPLKELAPFITAGPLPVSPLAWREEDGVSHRGYVLEGLKLKELKVLQELEYRGLTTFELKEKTPAGIEKSIWPALRINTLAE